MKYINKDTLIFALLILLVIPSIIPLFRSGFIVTDDGGWMIIRLSAFYDTIIDGQIPARFIERLNFGYGYPVANFLYPGFLYLGSVIHILGFSFIDSVKILFGASLIFSAVFSFIWLKKLFNSVDAFFGAIVYTYIPYHLFDIYKRGSIGESLSISVLPLVLFGLEKGSTLIVSLSVFLILIFHNTLAVFFLPLIPIYALIRKSFVKSLPGMLLGGAISSFFTIPAIVELKYTQFLNTPISNPTEYFADPHLIGTISVAVFLASIILIIFIYRNDFKKTPYRGFLVFFMGVFILSAFLASSLSSFVWENISSSFVQFPYRFLSLTIIAVSFLASYLSYILFSKIKFAVIFIGIIILSLSSFSYLKNIEYLDFPDEYYSTNDATTTVHDEYMPIWVKEKPQTRPESKVQVITGEASISNIVESSNRIEFDTEVLGDSKIRVNTIYYPGWKAFVEGEQREIHYDNEFGAIELELKEYDDKVYLTFQDDLLRIISNTISLVGVLILIYYISRPIIKF